MAIGEAGSITTNSPGENDPITVTFAEALTDPVIVLSSTANGADPFTLRVVDQDIDGDGNTTSFTFIIEEWEYLDGPHPASETISWIAIEEGVHTLPDGRVIEAGTTDTDASGSSVALSADFDGDTPVVLTSVMSENDTTTVDSDPLNITSTGFDIELQEEEGEDDNHASETVGWIAIQPGGDVDSGTAQTFDGVDENVDVLSLGDDFLNAIVVVETQTIRGGNPETVRVDSQSNTNVGVFIQEEQSGDSEVGHVNEEVGIVAFEAGPIPCFTTGARIHTAQGPRPVEALRPGDQIVTRDNGLQTLRWVCERKLSALHLQMHPDHRPVLLKANSLGPGVPRRDVLVSPQHRFLMSGWRAQLYFGESELLVPARGLVNDQTIKVMNNATQVTYYHLLLDQHEVVRTDHAWSESLHAGQLCKIGIPDAAREELFQLMPDLRTCNGAYGPTARPVARVQETRMLKPV